VANVTLSHLFSLEIQVTLTLLADLDDTLLGNDFGNFLPYYLDALGKHLKPFAEPSVLIPKLMAATHKMIENNRPDRTLKQVFEDEFFSAIDAKPEKMQVAFDTFYDQVFPQLRRHTNFRPEAIQFVNQTLKAGCRVVIATNPLFPRTAILERLEWAGLSPQEYAFSLITSYESFHFAKPNPAYFAEILAQIGWPEGGIVMIGDNLEDDIVASRRLGLPAFWISTQETAVSGPYAPTAFGTISDCSRWLDSVSAEVLQPDYRNPESLIAILRSTPAALDTLLTNLSQATWILRPEENEWSLTEIICHLRDVEIEVNLPRLHKVLHETNPFIAGQDTDPWVDERQYIDQNGLTALVDFTVARIHLLNMLESLSQDSWNRAARHAIFGPTDLEELTNFISGHDQLHLRQVFNQLIKTSQYPEDIAPLAA
jgi:HAD superfamily hydrolase (TIGR01549 family)